MAQAQARGACYHDRMASRSPWRLGSIFAAAPLVLGGCSAAPSPGGDGSCPSAHPLTGAVTRASGGVLTGWVRDDDRPDLPPLVQVFVDGAPLQRLRAEERREDGAYGFRWDYQSLGPGPEGQAHRFAVYGNGVDCQGRDDGAAELQGSPSLSDDGCAGLPESAAAFCALAPSYFQRRQRDSALVGDAQRGAQVSVSRAYGGALLQLRGAQAQHPERLGDNLLAEHGAMGAQLAIGGYGLLAVGGPLDPSYGYEGADLPCDPQGDPRPPGRVTQAQGPACGFAESQSGLTATRVACLAQDEHQEICVDFADTLRTVTLDPFHSTRKPAPLVGLRIDQWARVLPEGGGLRLRYRLRYQGAQAWAEQAQELPQIVTADGLSARVYSYLGARPFQGDTVAALPLGEQAQVLRLPGLPEARYPHRSAAGVAREGWWCVCSADEARCLTIAALGPEPDEAQGAEADSDEITEALLVQRGPRAVVSALGSFALAPGLRRSFAVLLFPYRYDQPIPAAAGLTPRDLISRRAPAAFRARSAR